jgi:AcrR family transcriptional regulator
MLFTLTLSLEVSIQFHYASVLSINVGAVLNTPARDANQRNRKRENSRQQILDAATRVFAREGFEAASMAGIAEQAGVKKALVQYHFETKENLWKEAVRRLWAQRDTTLPDIVELDSLEQGQDALRSVLRAIVEFTRQHPEWLALMFRESHNPGPRLTWLIDHYLSEDIRRGCSFVEHAQDVGLLPRTSPLQLLHLISGALSYNLLVAPMTRQATGVDLGSQESIAEQVEILLRLLENARG